MARYETRKKHLTAMEKRFFPGDVDKPFVVWDTKQDRAVGRRYGTQSGADAEVGRRNKVVRRKAHLAEGREAHRAAVARKGGAA